MWHLTPSASEHPAFVATARELLVETSQMLVGIISCVYILGFIMSVMLAPQILRADVWLLTILVVLISAMTFWLNSRHVRFAQLVWQGGIVGIITIAIAMLQQPEIALFYILVPLLAAMTFSWWAVPSEGIVLGLLWFWTTGSSIPPLPSGLAILIGGIAALGGLLGWAFALTLTRVTQWSLFSFDQANQQVKQAQEHRGEMAQMVKALDHAYYRLERANAALVAARKEAGEAERFKTDFVANVSHELRTPLNLIIGFSEVMLMSPESYGDALLPGSYRSDLNAIYHSAQHLLALVDDVLDLSWIEAGKFGLSREDLDVAGLVFEAVDTLRDYIAKKRLELFVTVAPDVPRISVDRLRIRQVLLNLLVNASRFTERGSITVDVRLVRHPSHEGQPPLHAPYTAAPARADTDAAVVLFNIRDTGQGISAQDVQKIFQEFQSTDAPFSKWHSGTGLGLPISRKFVHLHDGDMGVESVLGQGTTVWFTLPAALAPTEATQGSHVRWTPYVPLGDSRRAIVVVHPDLRVAGLLSRYLDHFQVTGVETLADGIALADDMQAIALLHDSAQPTIEQPGLLSIRCPLPSEQQAAHTLGAQDYLVKPFSRTLLLAAIARIGHPVGVSSLPMMIQRWRSSFGVC